LARLTLGWSTVIGLLTACGLVAGCAAEDEPDTGQDAASDAPLDRRSDTSVRTDVSSDAPFVDRRDAGNVDTITPEGGNCVGGGDAARDGAAGMIAVQALACARCHQDEPADAGLILSGRTSSVVNGAAVFPKNLTPDPTGLGCWTDEQIVNAILNGIDNEGRELCRMPKFGTRIDGGVAQEIVDFLRTLPAVRKEIPDLVGSCPPPNPPPDAGIDVAAPDAGADVAPPDDAAPDAPADVTAPDAGDDGDTPPPEGGLDAGADGVAPDGAAPDASDATAPDSESPDVDIDAGTDGDLIDGDVTSPPADVDIDAAG
jgi:hypothetical protein